MEIEEYIKLLHIKDGALLARYRINGWSQFAGVPIAKWLVQEILLQTVLHLSWPLKVTPDTRSHSTVLL